ncbi:hypothetical protein Tco_1299215, partial [Tanacetum coccineum]
WYGGSGAAVVSWVWCGSVGRDSGSGMEIMMVADGGDDEVDVVRSLMVAVVVVGGWPEAPPKKIEERISSKALPRRLWGLRVADSRTGKCLEDSFTPLETIQRFQSTIRRRSHSSSKGRPSSRGGGEEFNGFLTLYPIPSEYRVILPKSNHTIFDAPPRHVRLFIYRGSTLLVVPNSPLLLSCAKLMVVSPLLTSSESSSICVELHIGRYPTSVCVFPDPILFLAGLKPSWEYEMASRNFIYTKDDEDLSFLPKEPSLGFGTGSPFVLLNM